MRTMKSAESHSMSFLLRSVHNDGENRSRPRPAARRPSAGASWRPLAARVLLLLGLGLLLELVGPVERVPLSLVTSADAQSAQAGERAFTNRYARPGRPTMTVYVWGEVGNTGIWRVERDIGLIELLSAVQVPGLGDESPEFERQVLVTVYRQQGDRRSQVYQRQLEEIASGAQDPPSLQEGDILEIRTEQQRQFSFSTVTTYIGTASSLLLLALRLFRR